MVRRITGLTLILVAAGCQQGGLLGSGDALSYAQYHTLEKGMRTDAIVNAFGGPAHTLEQDGKIRGLTYRCEDATGTVRQLRMVFSAEERLEQWALVAPDGSKPAS